MKTIRSFILLFLFSSCIIHECYCQPNKYRGGIRPKVKHSLDSLYPYAKPITLETYLSDTAQLVSLACNCPETKAAIILLFDTNGNLLNKEVHYQDMKNLPDTLAEYIKKNTTKYIGFHNNFMSKSINNKNEITYGIMMQETKIINGNPIEEDYILKFKSTGEFISKTDVPGAEM
jgi:hypothetical protein